MQSCIIRAADPVCDEDAHLAKVDLAETVTPMLWLWSWRSEASRESARNLHQQQPTSIEYHAAEVSKAPSVAAGWTNTRLPRSASWIQSARKYWTLHSHPAGVHLTENFSTWEERT